LRHRGAESGWGIAVAIASGAIRGGESDRFRPLQRNFAELFQVSPKPMWVYASVRCASWR